MTMYRGNEVFPERLLVVSVGDECRVISILPKEPDLLVTLYDIHFLMCFSQFVKKGFL